MEILDSIVCGIDGSKASIHACDAAMARMKPGQSVLAVAVLPQIPFAYDATAEVLDRLDQEIAAQSRRLTEALDQVAARGRDKGLTVRVVLDKEGRPFDRILERAGEAKAKLVVMGAGHHGELQRRIIGTTVSRVIGLGPFNVLVVPDGVDLRDGPIVTATDGSGPSLDAVRLAASLAKATGQPLIVLGVADTPGGAEDEPMSQLGAEILAEQARKQAEGAVESLAAEGVNVEVVVRSGRAFEQIAAVAGERSAGLVVMGSHGRTGLSRLLMGSTTERALEIAPCPVLVTRP